jgi:AraC-like DNA-binding protein
MGELRSSALPIAQAGLLFPTFAYARHVGADTESLRRRARLPVDVFDDPTRFLPTSRWYRLFHELVQDTGCRDIGWQVAWANPLKAYSREFNEGVSTAPSLLESLRFVGRAHKRHCNNHHFWVRVLNDFAYVFHYDFSHEPGYEQRAVFRTAAVILLARACLGDDWRPDLIVTETPLDAIPENDALEGTRIVQRRGYSAVRLPRAALAAVCRHPFQSNYEIGEPAAPNTLGQIKQLLRSYANERLPGIRELAELMHVSERSLQRRLADLNTSYTALIQEVRYQAAQELLRGSVTRITDIAHTLGYDDASHFSRFFRRMGGISPQEFRMACEQGGYRTTESCPIREARCLRNHHQC